MSVQELEAAVLDLSGEDLARFARWFDAHRDDLWDRQMEDDARAGRLADLVEEAEREIAAGDVRALP